MSEALVTAFECTAQRSNAQPCGRRSTLRSRLIVVLIVVLNEKLLEVMGDEVTQEQAFAHANDVLKYAVGGHPTTAAKSSTSRAWATSTLKTSNP